MDDNNVQRRKTIGVLMRLARENAGRTHRECAVFMGLSTARLIRYEEGSQEPTLVELEILAHYLDTSLHNLLDESMAERMTQSRADIDLVEIARVRTLIIGTRLRQARQLHNETLKTTAESVGLAPARLKNYELAKRPIPITMVEMLCRHFGIELQSLLDIGIGPLGEAQQLSNQSQFFVNLPPDIRDFVTHPDSLPYLRTAMRLRSLPSQDLHDAGTALLSLTSPTE